MNYTTHYNLNKPEPAEQYNINHWNQNSDTVDTALYNEVERATSAEGTLTTNLVSEITARENDCDNARDLANATGVLSVAKGGTGMATIPTALNNLVSQVTDLAPTTGDKFLFKNNNNVNTVDLDSFATKIYQLIRSKIESTIPIGVIYPFCGEFGTANDPYANVPDGYLACDGQAISRTTYSDLFAVIGTKYGNGDEITTFNVPDLRESVMVGAGQSTRAILDETGHSHDVYTLGEFKDDQIQNITGTFCGGQGTTTGAFKIDKDLHNYWYEYSYKMKQLSFDASRIARAGTNTHGKQLGVNFIIKY